MPKNPMKLKNVLLLPFLFLISLAVLVTSFLTWKYSEETTLNLGTQISKQSAYQMEEKLDYYLDNATVSNQLLKQVLQYDLIDTNNRQQMLDYIHYTMLENPKFGTLSFAYPDGSYMGISHTATGGILKKEAGPHTDRVFYTYELPTNRPTIEKANYDARNRPWFIQAKASNQPVWSTIFEMFSNDKLGVTYAEALRKNGQFIGVIGTDVVFYDLNEQLNRIRLTDNSYLFILDDKDNVIAQSDLSETHKGSGILHTVADSNNNLLKQAMEYIYHNDHVNSSSLHGDSYFEVDGHKEDYFVNFIPYESGEGLQWKMGVVIPKSDFLGHINEIRQNTFIIWFVSFTLSIILGLTITYLINNAIKRLHQKLEETELNGSMYYHDGTHKIQEVNDLSEKFSLMSKRLYESYIDLQSNNIDLENIVAERTESLKKANAELLKDVYIDELTNLANRRSFHHFLDFYWNNLKTKQVGSLSLLICDLDSLKQYNKTYGYSQGNELLKSFAKILESSVSELDIVTRIAGEEFVIILPNTSEKQASEVAEKIIQALSKIQIEHGKACTSDCMTTSIGIISITETDSLHHYELLSCADSALSLAKKSGKNQYAVYTKDE